ncbi:MAG: hypothetical protein GX601_19425 [Anaerolineales bacterium]|nr:hypothetical protein [Anaerolineales bacterium]
MSRLTDPTLPLLVAPTRNELAAARAGVADLPARRRIETLAFGMGLASAAALCRSLDARAQLPSALALIGWAGGLSPTLAAGEGLLADAAFNPQGRRAPCVVAPLAGARVGPMLTVPAPLRTPEDKRTAGRCGALAVEMEAYPLAVWAAERGVPFVHVRVILDPLDEALPEVGDALDPRGRVRVGALARQLIRQPQQAAVLGRLVRHTRALSPALREAARALVPMLREMA